MGTTFKFLLAENSLTLSAIDFSIKIAQGLKVIFLPPFSLVIGQEHIGISNSGCITAHAFTDFSFVIYLSL